VWIVRCINGPCDRKMRERKRKPISLATVLDTVFGNLWARSSRLDQQPRMLGCSEFGARAWLHELGSAKPAGFSLVAFAVTLQQ
jgi:hypothetical protein